MLFISLQVLLFAFVYLVATCTILAFGNPIETAVEDSMLGGCGCGGGGFELSGGCGCGRGLPVPF